MPALTVFAGPNGSGKSSLIKRVEFEGRENLLEPDAIAGRIKPKDPRLAGMLAGREVLRRTAEHLHNRESFALETTLAGRWTNSVVASALERSFFTRLFYICLDTSEWNIRRVRERVAQGGHNVPDSDVRRRYGRSLANARRLLPLVDHGLVFDNSAAEPGLIYEVRNGRVLSVADEIPAWAPTLLDGTETRKN